jgi:hypothetical protein
MSRLFGSIRQNGYVVRDLHAAMMHWASVLGVGPFFYAERIRADDFRYRGVPSSSECAIALAQSGDLQIELVQPLDREPSMFRDFLEAGREGLQHVAFWFDTPAKMDAALARAAELRYEIGHSGTFGENGRFAFLMTEGPPGTVIELSEVCGGKAQLFRNIAEAARTWDGSDAVRPLRRPT